MAIATGQIVVSLITTLITIPLSALLLWLSGKIFKVADKTYVTALKVAAIVGASGFVLGIIASAINRPILAGVVSLVLINILLAAYLVKTFYDLEWGKAALVWLVWFVFGLILAFILAMILGILFVAAGIAALGTAA